MGFGPHVAVGVSAGFIVVPDGYIEGDPISANMTFAGESFASFGASFCYESMVAGRRLRINVTTPTPSNTSDDGSGTN